MNYPKHILISKKTSDRVADATIGFIGGVTLSALLVLGTSMIKENNTSSNSIKGEPACQNIQEYNQEYIQEVPRGDAEETKND